MAFARVQATANLLLVPHAGMWEVCWVVLEAVHACHDLSTIETEDSYQKSQTVAIDH